MRDPVGEGKEPTKKMGARKREADRVRDRFRLTSRAVE